MCARASETQRLLDYSAELWVLSQVSMSQLASQVFAQVSFNEPPNGDAVNVVEH